MTDEEYQEVIKYVRSLLKGKNISFVLPRAYNPFMRVPDSLEDDRIVIVDYMNLLEPSKKPRGLQCLQQDS